MNNPIKSSKIRIRREDVRLALTALYDRPFYLRLTLFAFRLIQRIQRCKGRFEEKDIILKGASAEDFVQEAVFAHCWGDRDVYCAPEIFGQATEGAEIMKAIKIALFGTIRSLIFNANQKKGTDALDGIGIAESIPTSEIEAEWDPRIITILFDENTRDFRIAQLLIQGKSRSEIEEIIGISTRTAYRAFDRIRTTVIEAIEAGQLEEIAI